MLRLQHEQVFGGSPRESGSHYYSYVAPNMFAGSLLNLEPGTEYECHFVLSDPDGVKGKAERTVIAHTRAEPQPAAGGHVYHVYPFGYQGAKQEPAFTGLLAAYFMGSDQSDHSNALPPRVQLAISSWCMPAFIKTAASSMADSTARFPHTARLLMALTI